MDFLDPKKQKAHAIRLAIGYVVLGLVVLLATIILLYQAYGYSIDRHGKIIQNGLVFISSAPDGAEIYINGHKKDTTGSRLVLPAGQYVFELRREGYRTWRRAITVQGGTLQRFNYPFLFPVTPETTTAKAYQTIPEMVSQSIDRRWLLVQTPTANSFDLFDLDRDEFVPSSLAIPAEVLSVGSTTVGWEAIDWAKDNKHVLLRRLYDRAGQRSSEFIMVDRETPAESRNLSVLLGFTPTILKLRDQAYDQYYAFDQPNGALFTASLEQPTPQPYLDDVLAFESEGKNTVMYATTKDAPPGKTLLRLREDDQSYTLRQVATDAAPYLLDLARFDGAWFVAAGASAEHKVYIYKDPLDALKKETAVAVPVHILKVTAANYLSFAPQDRFVVAENGSQFALYDVKIDKGYAYSLPVAVSDTSGHAVWMDGSRLQVVSGDQLMVFDYDGTNRQALVPASPSRSPHYDRDYRRLYTFNPAGTLEVTHLRTQADR